MYNISSFLTSFFFSFKYLILKSRGHGWEKVANFRNIIYMVVENVLTKHIPNYGKGEGEKAMIYT